MYSNGQWPSHTEAFVEQDPGKALGHGALRVNLKMDVTTSGVHDGLMITTGIQTPGSGGFLNGSGRFQCPQQQQFWPWQGVPTSMPTTTPPMVNTENPQQQIEQLQNLDDPNTPAILPPPKTSASAAGSSEECVRTSTEAFLRERTNGGRYELDTYKRAAESSSLRNVEQSPSNRRILEHSVPEALSSSNIKLNLFESDGSGRAVELVPSFGHFNAIGTQRPPLEIEQRPQPTDKDLLLNDSTTTTTTLEVFRGRQSPNIDWFQLPSGPLTPDADPELIASRGPDYERSDKAETRFADETPPPPPKAVQWATTGDRSFDSAHTAVSTPTRHYYTVREPPSTASLPRSPIVMDNSWVASTSAHSTPHSSQWNLAHEAVDAGTPMATIVRRQSRERNVQRIVSSQSLEAAHGVPVPSRIAGPSPPPRPPKRRQQQPQTQVASSYEDPTSLAAPPRPTARKPQYRVNGHVSGDGRRPIPAPRRSVYASANRSQSVASRRVPLNRRAEADSPVAYPPPAIDSRARREANGQATRSASSNEIFKLYQTRDCLGRVLYEL